MQYINIKNFQKDFFKVVKDLPVTITKYGVPMYVLTKVDTNVAPKILEKNSVNKFHLGDDRANYSASKEVR
jgi:hypothetical protein